MVWLDSVLSFVVEADVMRGDQERCPFIQTWMPASQTIRPFRHIVIAKLLVPFACQHLSLKRWLISRLVESAIWISHCLVWLLHVLIFVIVNRGTFIRTIVQRVVPRFRWSQIRLCNMVSIISIILHYLHGAACPFLIQRCSSIGSSCQLLGNSGL